jgi:seryl-tRNA(Sec) selenium transferase
VYLKSLDEIPEEIRDKIQNEGAIPLDISEKFKNLGGGDYFDESINGFIVRFQRRYDSVDDL